MRKLATIRTIKDIRPIDNADAIECAIVDGWECVIAKKDGFKIGDLVVYIEIDSIVPDRPEFEFLRDRKFRVRTIKLRKQISQGLVVPLSILPKGKYKLDDDVTEILEIKKYDPQEEQERKLFEEKQKKIKNPFIKFLLRFKWFRKLYIKPKKGGFPAWIVKTDEERIQNKTKMFEIERDNETTFNVTEKIDGQSVTFFAFKENLSQKNFDFGVCSRNIYLKNKDNSSYWTIAKQYDIENMFKNIYEASLPSLKTIVLQGEIIGDGIQGNKYKINGYDFYAYNLIIDDKKFTTKDISLTLGRYGIKTVPIVIESMKLPTTISDMVEISRGKSVLVNIKREGIVCRNMKKNISFKVINPDFLLAEDN